MAVCTEGGRTGEGSTTVREREVEHGSDSERAPHTLCSQAAASSCCPWVRPRPTSAERRQLNLSLLLHQTLCQIDVKIQGLLGQGDLDLMSVKERGQISRWCANRCSRVTWRHPIRPSTLIAHNWPLQQRHRARARLPPVPAPTRPGCLFLAGADCSCTCSVMVATLVDKPGRLGRYSAPARCSPSARLLVAEFESAWRGARVQNDGPLRNLTRTHTQRSLGLATHTMEGGTTCVVPMGPMEGLRRAARSSIVDLRPLARCSGVVPTLRSFFSSVSARSAAHQVENCFDSCPKLFETSIYGRGTR